MKDHRSAAVPKSTVMITAATIRCWLSAGIRLKIVGNRVFVYGP
jgi:hypothetical protein